MVTRTNHSPKVSWAGLLTVCCLLFLTPHTAPTTMRKMTPMTANTTTAPTEPPIAANGRRHQCKVTINFIVYNVYSICYHRNSTIIQQFYNVLYKALATDAILVKTCSTLGQYDIQNTLALGTWYYICHTALVPLS